jgi:signal transduction histidine kinase
MGYKNELVQVIINIFNNARDIIIEVDPKIKIIFVTTYQKDKNAFITITDCAGGVPLDIIDTIFEPYITTKNDDKGTGIGLDISKNIIEKADGELCVSNTTTTIDDIDYKGACFTIKLPLS